MLRTQFNEICIPHAVKAALGLLGYPSALKDIQQAIEGDCSLPFDAVFEVYVLGA